MGAKAPSHDGEPLIFLPHLRRAEEGIAARIKSLAGMAPLYPPIDFEKAVAIPSVGPGTVLHDLIESGVLPTVRLTEVFTYAVTIHRSSGVGVPVCGDPTRDATLHALAKKPHLHGDYARQAVARADRAKKDAGHCGEKRPSTEEVFWATRKSEGRKAVGGDTRIGQIHCRLILSQSRDAK